MPRIKTSSSVPSVVKRADLTPRSGTGATSILGSEKPGTALKEIQGPSGTPGRLDGLVPVTNVEPPAPPEGFGYLWVSSETLNVKKADGSSIGIGAGGGGVTIEQAIAHINALSPTCFCLAADDPAYVTEDAGNGEAGTQITTWIDLSGNGNDLTEATDANQPTLVDVSGTAALRLDKDDGTGGDGFAVPAAVLSGLTAATIFLAGGKTNNNTQQTILAADDTDMKVRHVSGTTLAWYIGGAGNFALVSDNHITPRLYCLVFNGVGSGNSGRARIRIDKAWREVAYTGTIPAAVPTVTSARFGGWGGAEPSEGDWYAFITFDYALTQQQIETVENALRTLLPWVAALPNPNTALTESFETISDGAAVDETATGHTLAVGSAVQVAAGSGGVHRAFSGIRNMGGSTIRVGYRKATTHGHDADSTLAYKESTNDGATFGSEVALYDTPGIDDREVRWWEWSGQRWLGQYLYNGSAMLAVAGPDDGSPLQSVAGFVLDTRARLHTNRPIGYDENKYVLNGGQWPFTGAGSRRRIGLVDKTSSPGSIRWIEHTNAHLDECGIARIDASTLVMVCRAQSGGDYTVTSNMRLLRSTDNGATWSCQAFSFIAAGPNLYYHAPSGLLFCGFREVASGGTQIYTSIIWSDDAGVTWSPVQRITGHLGNDCGYPDFAPTSDDSFVLCTFYSSTGTYVVPLEIDPPPGASWPVTTGAIAEDPNLEAHFCLPELSFDVAGSGLWEDSSAHGRDLTLGATTAKPSLDATGWNGTHASVSADGGDTATNNAIGALPSGEDVPCTIAWCDKRDTLVNQATMWSFGNSGGSHWFRFLYNLTSPNDQLTVSRFDTISRLIGSTVTGTDPHRWVISFTGTTITVFCDGVKVVNNVAYNHGAVTTDRFCMFAMQRATIANHVDGHVREWAYISAARNDAACLAIDTDMATRCPL